MAAFPAGEIDEHIHELAPALTGPASLSGVVKSSDGHVVSNARVSWSLGPLLTWDDSKEDGSFTLKGLPEDEVVVEVACRERESEWFTLSSPDDDATLTLSIPLSEVPPFTDGLEEHQLAEDSEDSPRFKRELYLISTALGVLGLGLLFSMQQSSQRRRLLFAIVALGGMIEIPFQVEEVLFRQDRDTLRDFAESQRDRGQALSMDPLRHVLLDSEDCPVELKQLELWNGRISLTAEEDFTMWWHRPLCRGFSIGYGSSDGDVWIQD